MFVVQYIVKLTKLARRSKLVIVLTDINLDSATYREKVLVFTYFKKTNDIQLLALRYTLLFIRTSKFCRG